MEQSTIGNRLHLVGSIQGAASFSHTVGDTAFCSFLLGVERRSGTLDVLPVTAAVHLMPEVLREGETLAIGGQLRAYRQHLPDRRTQLHLTAFAKSVVPQAGEEVEHENAVELTGRLVLCPNYRQTPSKREITDLLLAVPRAYGRVDCIPVIAWGGAARRAAALPKDTVLFVRGRFQSRAYQKRMPDGGVDPRTAYEVSASELSVFS